MFLAPRDTSNLISIVSFTFIMRCQFMHLASAPFTSFHLGKFGWLPFHHHHHILLTSQYRNNKYSALTYRIIEMVGCQKSKCSSSWPPIITFICIVNIQTFIPTFTQTHSIPVAIQTDSGGFNGRPHVQWPARPQHNGPLEAPRVVAL